MLCGLSTNFLRLCLLLVLLNSCVEECIDFELPKFRDLRRPPVLTEWHWDELIDYDCSAVLEEDCGPVFDPISVKDFQTNENYVLAQADVLEVAVFDDLDTIVDNAVIASDGNLYYTFINEVPAAGSTAEDLGKTLEEKLSFLYINPIVTVTPRSSFDKNYKILGRLSKPGVYMINDHITLLDAIAEAGGFLTESYKDRDKDSDLVFLADLKESFVLREGKKLDVDFDELVFKGNKSQNIEIQAGDYIYIAATDVSAVFILGNIRTPQRLRYKVDMRLSQAIGYAMGWNSGLLNQTGGFGGGIVLGTSGSGTAYAPDLTRIIVIRGELDCPMVMTVDLTLILAGKARDLILQPGDIIFVSNKNMRFGRQLVRLAIDTFVQAFGSTAAAYYGNQWFPND